MPMTATMAPYTLFILDDDTPLNPREDYDLSLIHISEPTRH